MSNKGLFFCVICALPVYAAAAQFTGVALTAAQCDSWKSSGSIELTNENKKVVEDSCRKRYASTNALDNCTFYEAESLVAQLKEQAKGSCK